MRRILPACAMLLVLLGSACSAATPTVDPAQIQASAVAAASTMVAMTQASIPTATEVPPTEVPSPTPLPLPTIVELPTLAFEAPTAAPTQSSADDCNHLLDLNAVGNARAKLLINNNTKGPVTLTMGWSTKNAFGECGYLSWSNIPRNSSITVSVPQTGSGPCYWAYAWINDSKQQTTVSGGGYCMNNTDKWTFDIGYENFKLTPP
jgi:hypothetical protein